MEFSAEMGDGGEDTCSVYPATAAYQSLCQVLDRFLNHPHPNGELHFSDKETKARRDEEAC